MAATRLARVQRGAQTDPHRRYRLLDSLRGLAALSVLFYHVAFRFPVGGVTMQYLSQRNSGPPVVAVVLFFLISGFVLYRPFVAARYAGRPMPPVLPYAVRRFARIAPAYWLALAIAAIWLGLHYVLTPIGFIRYFGFLQLYAGNRTATAGIGVAWTLCVEVSFYAVLPLLARAARWLGRGWHRSPLRSELVLFAAMVLTALAWQAVVSAVAPPDPNGWRLPLLSMLPGSLDFFAAGMLLAALTVHSAQMPAPPRTVELIDRRPWLPWLLAGGLLIVEGRLPASLPFTAWWMLTHFLKLIACALLLLPAVFGAERRGWLRRVLGWRPLVGLGVVSYGVYLWHYQLLVKLAPRLVPRGELVTTLGLIAATLAVATVSFYVIERPAQQLARRWLRARRGGSGVSAIGPLLTAPPDPRG
ncbi:MAG: acyltransferase family protein [Solirubrobacteraceae bacterium]